MKKTGFFIFLTLILFSFVLAGCLPEQKTTESQPGARQGQDEEEVQETGLEPSLEPKPATLSYVQEGNLVNQTGSWQLLYDDPKTGNPAAITDLEFDNNSKCDLGQGSQVCKPDEFVVGTRVLVEGIDKEGEVVVVKITAL